LLRTALTVSLAPHATRRADFLLFSPPMSARVKPNRIAAIATLAYTIWMEYVARQNARGGKPFFPYPL
jgi:hypothetical protein